MVSAASKLTVTRRDQPQRNDFHNDFRNDVLTGLHRYPKTLPCKYLYDEYGSSLFDRICELDEYYPTRTEIKIMQQHIDEIVERVGSHALLVEYGSGSSIKTRLLLNHLPSLSAYVPIDISQEHLHRTAAQLAADYKALTILPVCADYTYDLPLPHLANGASRVVAYFPGSTIGNFEQEEACAMLKRMARVCGPGGGLLIGVDLKKDASRLKAAYDDRLGVTAAFNLNLLRRINRELRGSFRLNRFAHTARYNAAEGRVEMHLVSLTDQCVKVAGQLICFHRGETIHTENSYKYNVGEFANLAESAGFTLAEVWTDEERLFSVQYLIVT